MSKSVNTYNHNERNDIDWDAQNAHSRDAVQGRGPSGIKKKLETGDYPVDWDKPEDNGFLPGNDRMSAKGDLQSHDYRLLKHVAAFTGFDEDPSTKAPKPSSEQVAKSARSRLMQILAEERADEIDNTFSIKTEEELGENQRKNEFRDAIEEGIQSIKDGTIALGELRELKEALNDVVLSTRPDVRQKQLKAANALLDQIDKIMPIVEKRETEAIELRIMEVIPERMDDALHRLYTWQRNVKEAVQKKEWERLFSLNRELLKVAHEIWILFDILRRRDADRLYNLAHEIGQNSPSGVRSCKTNVINFVSTHNSFNFSPQAIRQISNENSKFADALCKAYQNRPEQDNVLTFLQKITRIPERKLRQMLEKAA